MKFVYYLWILVVAGWGFGTVCAGQPPAEEKRPAERRGQDRPQGVPLDKLPVPENGVIVVTPDLKKALDALGAGSVVLSAERYLELMSKAEKTKSDKLNPEILFAKCQIMGEINQVAGQEFADLAFELEFRTETPNAVIPIPFKGIRFTSATLNGQAPIWGPEPEKWTLLVKEPQVCRLKLTASVQISRTGQEKRLILERVPSSAITSLELLVPERIPSAMILGYGSINLTPVAPDKTRFTAPALGVLSSLELSWQTGESGSKTTKPGIEGDVRLTIEDAQALVEARFKPAPFAPIQLPWKVRLPKNSQQVRAELVRSETGGAESLVVTRQTNGNYVLATPYAVNMAQFSQVIIRWRQPLPDTDSAESILLGSCELLEPTEKQQTGTFQVVIPEDPTVFLKPYKLTGADRNFLGSERENRRTPRYRYTEQPAGLEATSLPRSQARGLLEARMQHTLGVQEQTWFLHTEIEVVRSNRASPSQLELEWPGDWQVSRKLLFTPAVKEIEQDSVKGRLRIILDGKQPASFILKLESTLSSSLGQVSVKLPQLLSALSMRNERPAPLDVLVQQERLRLESRGWDLQAANMIGLREDAGEGTKRAELNNFLITGHPAQLSVQRQPRLPKWSSQIETYIGTEMLQTRQHIQLHSQTSLPRKLTMLVPRSVKAVQFSRVITDLRPTELLHSVALSNDETNPWKKYAVDLPVTSEKAINLLCQCEQEAKHPITVPLVRLDESFALFEGEVTVRCFHEAGLKLSIPPELPAWNILRQEAGRIELHGESLQSLLVLDRQEDVIDDTMQRIKENIIHVEQDGTTFLIEHETEFADLRLTALKYEVRGLRTSMTLLGWKLNGRVMPVSQVQWNELEGTTVLTFPLPPEMLYSPAKIKVAMRVKQEGMSYLSQLPGSHWNIGSTKDITPITWRIKSDPSSWLWWSNKHCDKSIHSSYGWLPSTPEQQTDSNSDWSLNLQGLTSSVPLRWLAIPRSLSIVIISALALILLRALQRYPAWAKRVWGTLLGLLLILFVLEPGLASVLFWGALSGVVVGLALPWITSIRQKEPLRVQVFQTSRIMNQSSLSSKQSTGNTTDALTIISASSQGLR
ncbi:MAG: hypothetical protein QM703_08155 [Gemmatales bacterium]